ncbi:MAG: hypothetical protein P8X92_10735, partial [Dehalococcoidia bacterium]
MGLQHRNVNNLEVVAVIASGLWIPQAQFEADVCPEFGLELRVRYYQAGPGVFPTVYDVPILGV